MDDASSLWLWDPAHSAKGLGRKDEITTTWANPISRLLTHANLLCWPRRLALLALRSRGKVNVVAFGARPVTWPCSWLMPTACPSCIFLRATSSVWLWSTTHLTRILGGKDEISTSGARPVPRLHGDTRLVVRPWSFTLLTCSS